MSNTTANELAEPLLPSGAEIGDVGGDPSSPQTPSQEGETTTRSSTTNAVASATSIPQQEEHVSNRNIAFTLIYTCFAFAGRSIWQQSVLATYVFLIMEEKPEAVGFITAVMGMTQLCASIPTGYYADKHRRDTMLKIASAVGIVAISMTTFAVFVVQSYYVLVGALAIWGVVWGIANTALGALFADSIRDGDRPYYFTKRSILINLGNTVGPTMALAMFFVLGDHWTIRDCAIVISLGQAICFPAIIILALFNDNDAVTSTATNETNTSDNDNRSNADADMTEPLLEMAEEASESEGENQDEATNDQQDLVPNRRCDNIGQHDPSQDLIFCCIPRQRLAPILISIGDLTSGLASGMSIRYFPIFFVDRLHLNPVEVQILYMLTPLSQACLMKFGQYTSQKFGRCPIAIAHKWIGVSCMVALVLSAHFGLPAWFICTIFVIRTGFMNSTSPLTKSILMDNVPAQERGRWSALESVNMFSWSGSAAFGGFLVSFDGLLFNFSVTATLQFLATMPVLALMWTMDVEGEQNHAPEPLANVIASPSETTTTDEEQSSVDTENPRIVRV